MGLHTLPDGRLIDPSQIETAEEKNNGDVECIMRSGKKFKIDTMTLPQFLDFLFLKTNGPSSRVFHSPRRAPAP